MDRSKINLLNASLLSCLLWGCGGSKAPDPATTPNISPVIDAGENQTINENQSISLAPTASDSDGSITRYLWEQTAGTNVTINQQQDGTLTFTTPDIIGTETLSFKITVTDDDGAINSDVILIQVTDTDSYLTLQLSDDLKNSNELVKSYILSDERGLLNNQAQPLTFDSNGLLTLELAENAVIDDDSDGKIDIPGSILLEFSAQNYIDERLNFSLEMTGQNHYTIDLISSHSDNLPNGVISDTAQIEIAQNTNENGDIAFTLNEASPIATEITLPRSAKLFDAQGVQLPLADLTVVQATLPPDKVFQTVESIANIEQFNAATNSTTSNSIITFNSAAVFDLKIFTEQNEVKSILDGAGGINIQINVDPNVINPVTKNPIQAGDLIPVWSRSTEDNQWLFEQEVTIQTDLQGNFLANFTTNHLTWFNLAYIDIVDTCDGIITIEGADDDAFADQGKFTLTSARFNLEDIYLGREDGRLVYKNIPNVPTDIEFVSDAGGVKFIEEKTNISLFDTGSIDNQNVIIKDVNLCSSNNTLIGMISTETPKPTIVITDNPIYAKTEGESSQTLTYSFTAENLAQETITLDYEIKHGTTTDTDLTIQNATLTFDATQLTQHINISVLGDDIPEQYYESFYVSLATSDNAVLANGQKMDHFTHYIIDDDTFVLESIGTITASEATKVANIQFELNKALPNDKSIEVCYQTFSSDTDSASAHLDYISYEYNNYNSTQLSTGSKCQTIKGDNGKQYHINIPVIDDLDLENDEKFSIQFIKSRSLDMIEQMMPVTVTIVDNDAVSTAQPTELSINTTNLPKKSDELYIEEDDSAYIIFTLDTPAQQETQVDLSITQNNKLFFLLDDNGDNTTHLQTQMTFQAGEASKLVRIIAINDFDVSSDALVTIQLSSGLQHANTQAINVIEDDKYYAFIDLNRTYEDIFEDTAGDVEWLLSYTSNHPTWQPNILINTTDSSTADELDYQATYDQSITLAPVDSDNHKLIFKIIPDDIVEVSDTINVKFDLNSPIPNQTNGVFIGRSFHGASYLNSNTHINQIEQTKQLVILNDDLLTLSFDITRIKSAEKVYYKINTSEPSPIDLEFELTINSPSHQYIFSEFSSTTLNAGESTIEGDMQIENYPIDESFTLNVSLSLTEASLNALEEQKIKWVLPQNNIESSFYLIKKLPLTTGTTGGTGGSN